MIVQISRLSTLLIYFNANRSNSSLNLVVDFCLPLCMAGKHQLTPSVCLYVPIDITRRFKFRTYGLFESSFSKTLHMQGIFEYIPVLCAKT